MDGWMDVKQNQMNDSIKDDKMESFKCKYCCKTFLNHRLQQIHLNTHYVFQCSQCPKKFARKYLCKIHERSHSATQPFPCKECGQRFKHKYNLVCHERVHIGARPFRCIKCEENFTTRYRLQSHQKMHAGFQYLKCNLCDERFGNRYCLIMHKQTHAKVKKSVCSECGEKFTSRYYLHMHKHMHKGLKPFPCHVCGQRFSIKFDRTNHINSEHNKEKPFHCNKCDQSFVLRNELRNHKMCVGVSFDCEICDMKFSVRTNLTHHLKNNHMGVKRFQCPICMRQFQKNHQLTSHKRIHSNEKPFQCDKCTKCYSNRSKLNCHKRIHSDEPLPACKYCKRTFLSNYQLQRHEVTHLEGNPYKCVLCPNTFTTYCHLKEHNRVHSGEKSFQCETCGKLFSHKGSLTRHYRTHTGEKPYQCNICKRLFSEACKLKGHQKRVHSNDETAQVIYSDIDNVDVKHKLFKVFLDDTQAAAMWLPTDTNHQAGLTSPCQDTCSEVNSHQVNAVDSHLCQSSVLPPDVQSLKHIKSDILQNSLTAKPNLQIKDNFRPVIILDKHTSLNSVLNMVQTRRSGLFTTQIDDGCLNPEQKTCNIVGRIPTPSDASNYLIEDCSLNNALVTLDEFVSSTCSNYQSSGTEQVSRTVPSDIGITSNEPYKDVQFEVILSDNISVQCVSPPAVMLDFKNNSASDRPEHSAFQKATNNLTDGELSLMSATEQHYEQRNGHIVLPNTKLLQNGTDEISQVGNERNLNKFLTESQADNTTGSYLSIMKDVQGKEIQTYTSSLSEYIVNNSDEHTVLSAEFEEPNINSVLSPSGEITFLEIGRGEECFDQPQNVNKTMDIKDRLSLDDNSVKGHMEVSNTKTDTNIEGLENSAICNSKVLSQSQTGVNVLQRNTCLELLPTKYTLQVHRVKHCSGKQLECDQCQETFDTRYRLNIHKQSHHMQIKPFKCEECDEHFISFYRLEMHCHVHTGNYPYPCRLCEEKFKRQCHFKDHMKNCHAGEKPFECPHCDKLFELRYRLQEHSVIHSDSKPFACETCNKKFKSKYNLKDHVRKHHTGERLFTCIQCHKGFVRNKHLLDHEKTHLHAKVSISQELHNCTECSKEFTTKKALIRHVKIHAGEKSYLCKHCGRTFTENYQLNKHELIHTDGMPLKCKLCPQMFTTISHLKEHFRIHTGEKSFQCEDCGKLFSHKGSLTRHYRTHTGEKPYQCNICKRRFSEDCKLKGHQKRVHSKEKTNNDGETTDGNANSCLTLEVILDETCDSAVSISTAHVLEF